MEVYLKINRQNEDVFDEIIKVVKEFANDITTDNFIYGYFYYLSIESNNKELIDLLSTDYYITFRISREIYYDVKRKKDSNEEKYRKYQKNYERKDKNTVRICDDDNELLDNLAKLTGKKKNELVSLLINSGKYILHEQYADEYIGKKPIKSIETGVKSAEDTVMLNIIYTGYKAYKSGNMSPDELIENIKKMEFSKTPFIASTSTQILIIREIKKLLKVKTQGNSDDEIAKIILGKINLFQ